MAQGVIKKIVSERGFGFISAERGDVFFHCSTVADSAFDDLQVGQSVEYDLEQGDGARRGDKGPRAATVRPA
jgi:CspA family cold shock protein